MNRRPEVGAGQAGPGRYIIIRDRDSRRAAVADHVLTGLPVVKHVAAANSGTGAVGARLYRLAGVTAEACCPVSR